MPQHTRPPFQTKKKKKLEKKVAPVRLSVAIQKEKSQHFPSPVLPCSRRMCLSWSEADFALRLHFHTKKSLRVLLQASTLEVYVCQSQKKRGRHKTAGASNGELQLQDQRRSASQPCSVLRVGLSKDREQ